MPLQAIAINATGQAWTSLDSLAAPVWISGDVAGVSVVLAFAKGEKLVSGNSSGASDSALRLGLDLLAAGDATGAASVNAALGILVTVSPAAAAASLTELTSLAVGYRPTLLLAGSSSVELPLLVGQRAVVIAPDVLGAAAGAATSGAALSVGWPLVADAQASSGALCTFATPLPTVRQPLTGQYPGAVNIVPNPSLEYAAVGTTGWSGSGLSRSTTVAWSGGASAACARASAGTRTVTVGSVSGLQHAGYSGWIGSIWLSADQATQAALTLAAINGATETSGTIQAVDIPGDGSWVRGACFVVLQDGELADRFELRVEATYPAAGTVWLDGAQIEIDTGYGMTTYLDGDAGDIYRWGGEPGNSASAREPR